MKTSTRGIAVLIATIMIQLTVGLAYIWSAFQIGVADRLFNESQGLASLTFSLLIASLTISSVFGGRLAAKFGTKVVVIAGGIITGIGFITAGLVQPYIGGVWTGWLLWITYGILGGAGMGFTYATTIACTQKWYQHKRGLVTGLVVAALGLGTVAFTPLVEHLVQNFYSIISNWQAGRSDGFVAGLGGESFTFMILGGIILVVGVVCGLFMKNPPEGYMKDRLPGKIKECENCTPPTGQISDSVQRSNGQKILVARQYLESQGLSEEKNDVLENNQSKEQVVLASAGENNDSLKQTVLVSDNGGQVPNTDDLTAQEEEDCVPCDKPIVYGLTPTIRKIKRPKPREFVFRNLTPLQMLKKGQYYLITFAFLLATMGGLMLINFARPIAQLHGLDDVGGTNLAFLAILAVGISNAGGRLLWGAISDKLGRINTIFILLGVTAALAPFVAIVPPPYSPVVFVIIAIIGLCYGGILAIFPALTAELFGSKNLATNYGFVLLGFGAGAIIASQILAPFANRAMQSLAYNPTGNGVLEMLPAFIIAAAAAFVASMLLMTVKLLNRATRRKIAGIFLSIVRKIKPKKKDSIK